MLPVVDVSSLVGSDFVGSGFVGSGRPESGPEVDAVAREIERACQETGFFYVTGHGVPADLIARLDAASRAFFRLPEPDKMAIAMARGGRAWRGYFPVGAELTGGRP